MCIDADKEEFYYLSENSCFNYQHIYWIGKVWIVFHFLENNLLSLNPSHRILVVSFCFLKLRQRFIVMELTTMHAYVRI